MRAVLCITLLLAVGLAGCSSDAPPPKDPDALAGFLVEPEPGVFVDANRGIVRGTIQSEARLPVADARVQLVGTDHFERTAASGRFMMDNVTLGEHTLRVEASGFLVHEEAVMVTAGNITDVEVFLLFDTSKGAGRTPHVHDRWQGRESHVLFDGVFDFRKGYGDSEVDRFGLNEPRHAVMVPNRNASEEPVRIPFPAEDDDGRVNTVYPGASHIEVTFAWDSSSTTATRIGLAYTPDGHEPDVVLQPRTSGQAWTIPVTPATWDNGHQLYSFWGFFAYFPNEVLQAPDWEAVVVTGPWDVKIEVFRGSAIPLEPEHPDFWGEVSMLVLDPGAQPAYEQGYIVNRREPQPSYYQGNGHFYIPRGELIPPGTTKVMVNHTWVYEDGQDLSGTPAEQEYVLTWRTAAQPWFSTPLSEYGRSEGVACGRNCVSYFIDVAPDESDAYYQERSTWAFVPSIAGYEDDLDHPGDPRRDVQHFARVLAFR